MSVTYYECSQYASTKKYNPLINHNAQLVAVIGLFMA